MADIYSLKTGGIVDQSGPAPERRLVAMPPCDCPVCRADRAAGLTPPIVYAVPHGMTLEEIVNSLLK